MIPKVAHFHWTGRPMSWLRMASIATFRMWNPGWAIILHDTDEEVKNRGLCPGQEADWTWWKALRDHGGFQVATDIIFVAPVPESWVNADLNVSLAGTGSIYQFAMMGASKAHSLMIESCKKADELVSSAKGKLPYQALGVDLLQTFPVASLYSEGLFDQPMDALCSITCMDVERAWQPGSLSYPADAIGIHWYGGHPSSAREWIARPGDDYAIMNLAVEMLELGSGDSETIREQHGI